MDIQTILDYQSLDFEKVKINRQLAKSDEYVRYTRANETTKKSVDNVAKMSTRAAQLFAKAEEIAAQFEAASKEYDEIAGAAEGLEEDLKRAEFYDKSLESLSGKLEQLEKEASAVATELSALSKDGEAEIASANKNAALAKSCKGKVDELKAQFATKLDEISAKQRELEEKADPQLLSIYRNARKQVKSFPVIVALRDEKLCGCGIELSGAELGKLKDGEPFVTCPTCGRLVYKPQQ